jgi:hypothetical protein
MEPSIILLNFAYAVLGGVTTIFFMFVLNLPNADEPQAKRSLTELNSHGRDFYEFISVRVLFREPDCFFCIDSLCNDGEI